MKAAVLRGPFQVEVDEVGDPHIQVSSDVVVRVLLACICGSDLWDYRGIFASEAGSRLGHEFLGVVEEVGRDVKKIRPGSLVIAPFLYSDGECVHCRAGLPTSCLNGGGWGWGGNDGGQGQFVRVPLAETTLVPIPKGTSPDLLPALLTLSDVMCTGHHAAQAAGVGPGSTVVVVGDGAVGLCGVLASRRLGAERIVLMSRHTSRAAVAVLMGATDVISEKEPGAVDQVKEWTGGYGALHVLECVGTQSSWATATEVVRAGGVIGYVGVPAGDDVAIHVRTLFGRNVSVRGGLAPARSYLPELLPEVAQGFLDPSPVFDRRVTLSQVADGYAAMHERTAIKVLVEP